MTACRITGTPPVCHTHDVLATDWTSADDGPTAQATHPTCPLAGHPVDPPGAHLPLRPWTPQRDTHHPTGDPHV